VNVIFFAGMVIEAIYKSKMVLCLIKFCDLPLSLKTFLFKEGDDEKYYF
jgi:hypothetical protein